MKQNLYLDVLESTATKREAKAYLSRFSPQKTAPQNKHQPLVRTRDVGVNLGNLYPPIRAVEESPIFSNDPNQSQFRGEAIESIHAALVKIRAPQSLSDVTLHGVAHTLSQLARLGLSCVVVIDPEYGWQQGDKVSKEVSKEADRFVDIVEAYGGQGARRLDSVVSVSSVDEQALQSFRKYGETRIMDRELILAPLRRGVIPVIAPIGYTSATQRRVSVDADEVVLALTRDFGGLQSTASVHDDDQHMAARIMTLQQQISLDRIIVLDPLGGIPSTNTSHVSHVFINLEQEFDSIRKELMTVGKEPLMDTEGEPTPPKKLPFETPAPSKPFSRVSANEFASADGGDQEQRGVATRELRQPSIQTHIKNLDLLRNALILLPPSSSAFLTTPDAVANSQSRPPLASQGPRVRTRRQQNPLIHNLLTDKPVFSSSLPSNRSPNSTVQTSSSVTTSSPATFFKRGMPVGIVPDPLAQTWQPPSTSNPSVDISDPRIDLPRLVHLIEDSFGRKLDVPHYFNRIKHRIAGIIVAGEYEGGAVLTWETPPGFPPDDPGHMIPYLDKFAVLKRSQGAGGVADIVFKAMVRDCFPNGVCWRSRKNNPVNKWYFERAKGTWKIPNQNWTMFWTTEGVEIHDETFNKYEGVCKAVIPSWGDQRDVVD